MNKTMAIVIGLVLLVILVLFSMTFTVGFNEVAIKTRFGKVNENSIIDEPGLKFRLPLFADNVTKYDKRLQLRESPLETVQTTDGLQVVVRAFMLWQIDTDSDAQVLKFYQSFESGVDSANQAILDQFRTAIRSGMSRYTFNDLIGSEGRLRAAEQAILDEMQVVKAKGIKPVSVGVSQLMLSPKTTQAVLTRMQASRQALAANETARGNAEATAITSRADAMVRKIQTFARQHAEEIRSMGNRNAARYLEQMNEEPGLAVFLAWLDALESTLQSNTTLIIPTAMAPFHTLRLDAATDPKGIPVPTDGYDPKATASSPPADASGQAEPKSPPPPAPVDQSMSAASEGEPSDAEGGS